VHKECKTPFIKSNQRNSRIDLCYQLGDKFLKRCVKITLDIISVRPQVEVSKAAGWGGRRADRIEANYYQSPTVFLSRGLKI